MEPNQERLSDKDVPGEAIPSEIVGEIPSGLLAELRRVDGEIVRLQAQQRGLVDGFVLGTVIDLAGHHLTLDIAAGVYRLTLAGGAA